MNFTQFLLILRARYKLILTPLIAIVLLTLVIVLLLPKSYTATTSMVLNYKGADPVTGVALPSQLMPGYMATQIEIIKSKTVALRVVDELKMAESQAVQQQFNDATNGQGSIRDWLANLLSGNVTVEPSREGGVINISFTAADPQFAATMANAFASAYQTAAVDLKIAPAQKASSFLNAQLKDLRSNFESAQRKLTAYQQEHNIDDADNRLGVETARMNELSSQLVAVQGQLIDASSREGAARRNAGASPDVMNNGLIAGLRSSVAAAETKFAEVSQRLSTNHPQYQSAKSEVDQARANLNRQIGLASSSISSNADIQRKREADLQAALAEQRKKVMELNVARDELKLLVNEVQAAQRAYEAASNRYTQTSLESRSTQSDVAILNEAVAPMTPSSPNVKLLALLAVFFGSMLGLGLAIIAEIMDRRVRSTHDLVEVLNVPVLGVLRQEKVKRPRLGFMPPLLPNALKPN